MPNVTLAFGEGVGGWTSEFSFLPETLLSLNNNFYTGGSGLLWRHNSTNVPRNEFYSISSDTLVKFVFNENVTVTKNYKTLEYQGSAGWDVEMETNLEKGDIEVESFVLKDGKNHAWIRGIDNRFTTNVDVNNANGIGIVTTISSNPERVNFDDVPQSVTVGDVIYRVESNSGTYSGEPALVGIVESIVGNGITITTTGVPGLIDENTTAIVTPQVGDFCLYVKNNEVNKSGIIGYYNIVTMKHSLNEEAELFSAASSTFITSE